MSWRRGYLVRVHSSGLPAGSNPCSGGVRLSQFSDHANNHFSESPILAGPSGPALPEFPRVIIVGEDPRLKCRQVGLTPWVDRHECGVAFAHPGRERFGQDRIADSADVAGLVVLADGFHFPKFFSAVRASFAIFLSSPDVFQSAAAIDRSAS